MKYNELIGVSIFLFFSILYLRYLYNRDKIKDREESDSSKALTLRVYLYLIFTIIICFIIIVIKILKLIWMILFLKAFIDIPNETYSLNKTIKPLKMSGFIVRIHILYTISLPKLLPKPCFSCRLAFQF